MAMMPMFPMRGIGFHFIIAKSGKDAVAVQQRRFLYSREDMLHISK
jgi:hypothetical protein